MFQFIFAFILVAFFNDIDVIDVSVIFRLQFTLLTLMYILFAIYSGCCFYIEYKYLQYTLDKFERKQHHVQNII